MKNRIRLLFTSDIHGSIYPYSYADGHSINAGLARLSTLIESLRDENTLLFDNGDILQGSPLSYFHFHERRGTTCPLTTVLKKMKYDYINLGNHDFNYGEEELFSYINEVGAPCITHNVLYKDEPIGPTYVIREMAGKKIAIFAVTTHLVPQWEDKKNIKHFKFVDAYEDAKKAVTFIKDFEKPDYIVGLYHGGFEINPITNEPSSNPTSENQAYAMLKDIPGLDVLLLGHQHIAYCGTLFGKTYIAPKANGVELGCVDIYTDTNVIEASLYQADTEEDEAITSLVQEEEDACQKWLDLPLGTTKIDLTVENDFQARLDKSQAITFLNRVIEEVSGAQLNANALFLNATGFKHSITMRDLVSTYPFPNTLVVKKVNGRILKEYLEKCAEFWSIQNDAIIVSPRFDFPHPMHFNYDMVDGVEYTIKVSNDIGSRIISLTRNGIPVQEEDEFTLCINNYRAAGGGDFMMLKDAPTIKEITKDVVEILADYIQEHKVIDFEPVHNIQVIR